MMARMNSKNTLDPKNPAMIDRIDYAIRFWGFTVLVTIPAIVITLAAYLNPFWFRGAGLRWAQAAIVKFSWIRSNLVTPIVKKYQEEV
jgi:hypothetical protein